MRHLLMVVATLLTLTACGSKPQVNDTGTISGPEAPQPAQQAPPTPAKQKAPPTWDETYTWPSKVAVKVGKPVECKPGKYAFPQDTKRGVRVTFTITNGSDQPLDTTAFSFGTDVQIAGTKAEQVYDTDGGCKAGNALEAATTVLPSKTYSYTLAYAASRGGEMQIALQETIAGDKAVFVGQV